MINKNLIFLLPVLLIFSMPLSAWDENGDDVLVVSISDDAQKNQTDDVLYITPSGKEVEDAESISGYCVILESYQGETSNMTNAAVKRLTAAKATGINPVIPSVNVRFDTTRIRMAEYYVPNLNVRFRQRSRIIVPGPRHVIIRRFRPGPRIHRRPPRVIHRRPRYIHRPPRRIHRPPRGIRRPPRAVRRPSRPIRKRKSR